MKKPIEKILDGETLTTHEAHHTMMRLLQEPLQPIHVSSFLTALRLRGVRAEELEGFADALLELAAPVELSGSEIIDVCGTGGDGKGTFNISTASAFVLAGAGYKVAKHGNYGVSSSCGSSNVVEALGIRFSADGSILRKALDRANICFLHAPLVHPALKNVQPIRKELGFRTVFNMLGPLVNPARPTTQMNGVYGASLLPLFRQVLSRRGTRFVTFHSEDGHDEITLSAAIQCVSASGETKLSARDFTSIHVTPEEIAAGATIEQSARILTDVLSGKGSPAQEAVVCANAALAMLTHEGKGTLAEYVDRSREAIRSGRAIEVLQRSVELT